MFFSLNTSNQNYFQYFPKAAEIDVSSITKLDLVSNCVFCPISKFSETNVITTVDHVFQLAPAEQMGINLSPWTSDEQKLLEQALKTFPASLDDRWAKIAESIPNRSKKECMKRYKVISLLNESLESLESLEPKSLDLTMFVTVTVLVKTLGAL